ncbi:MAG: hypothetical protein D6775_13955 [Caldilineae bacterium]|nr:MAG: hypothetical protein D6775_13955 [Caldilineae bacterium]
MNSDKSTSSYHSYLLRLWRSDTRSNWRASLQSARDGTVKHFQDAEDAWDYLRRKMHEGEADKEIAPG